MAEVAPVIKMTGLDEVVQAKKTAAARVRAATIIAVVFFIGSICK